MQQGWVFDGIDMNLMTDESIANITNSKDLEAQQRLHDFYISFAIEG